MASGSNCPIGFHLVIGCRDGAAAPGGADDLWYHTAQLWVYVSTFLRFSVSTFLRFYVSPFLRQLEDYLRGPKGSGGPSEGSGGSS